MRRSLVAALLAIVLLPAVPSSANRVDVADRNDTAGLLDVRMVKGWGSPPRWKIATYSRVRARQIWDRGYLLVFFDVFGNARYDYYALVRSTGRRMAAALWRDRAEQSDIYVVELDVTRPTRRTLQVKVPLTLMRHPDERLHYVWSVQTLLTGRSCPNVCFDFAPNGEGVTEPRKRGS